MSATPMLPPLRTPLVRLTNLFPDRAVYGKCEFLAPSGCFKIRGAAHLLDRLVQEGTKCPLIVPSMGNTALGAATGARAYGFSMVGVVPTTIAKAKDERLQALGVELIKIVGGGSDLLKHATTVAAERNGYFVHPHLDSSWTDGYQAIAAEVLETLPECKSLVFPLGGGGLLMGLTEYLIHHPTPIRLYGCEPFNYPKYATFSHSRSATITDGLLLEIPHPMVQQRIRDSGVAVHMVPDPEIAAALRELYEQQGMAIEPSSAITTAFVREHIAELEEPVCVVLTGQNVTAEDHARIRKR